MQISFQYKIFNSGLLELELYENILIGLHNEIRQCLNHYDFSELKGNYINNAHGFQHPLFWLSTEMSWLHLLNNALLRQYGNNMCSLRELTLWKRVTNEKAGRPDILLSIRTGTERKKYLIEGKLNEWKGKNFESTEMLDQYYNDIYDQAKRYHACIPGFINDCKETTILVTVFEWMRNNESIIAAKDYLHKSEEDGTDFCGLYTIGGSGMWVYGKAFKIEEKQPVENSIAKN